MMFVNAVMKLVKYLFENFTKAQNGQAWQSTYRLYSNKRWVKHKELLSSPTH
jgi:hypothetical protein